MRFVSGLFTLLLFLMLAAGGMAALLYHQYETPGPLAVSRVIAVPKGEGRIAIATRLEKEGAISNRWAFIANYLLRGAIGPKQLELKAGDYEIKKNASMADIMEMLTQGRGVLSKLTIPEGLTSLQIVEKLRAEDELVGDITDIPPEGALLPDTYRFSKGMDRRELLDRMQGEMQRFLATAWERRQPSLPIATPEEAIIFASIVEKETGRADERGRVAAVFMNRLKKGMRLQSDPTVIYGLVGGQGTLGRSITRADLDQKTAHNTYQIGGLPPTPICNPGRSAIEAVAQSADDHRPLLRRRRHRWSHVLRHAQRAQRGGDQLAQGREGAQEGCSAGSHGSARCHSGAARCRSRCAASDQRRPEERIHDGRARRRGHRSPAGPQAQAVGHVLAVIRALVAGTQRASAGAGRNSRHRGGGRSTQVTPHTTGTDITSCSRSAIRFQENR